MIHFDKFRNISCNIGHIAEILWKNRLSRLPVQKHMLRDDLQKVTKLTSLREKKNVFSESIHFF